MVLTLIIFDTHSVVAQEDQKFITTYDIKYIFSEDGQALIKQAVEITNKQKDIIPTSYSLIVKNIQIYDVVATDTNEKLEIETLNNGDETLIKAFFDDRQIGVDRKNTIHIEYKTRDLLHKVGKITSISIPPVREYDSIQEYYITLEFPNSLGNKLYLSPTPIKEETANGVTRYYFDKKTLESGVSAGFGDYQMYDFNLKYHLKNTSFLTSFQTIALPPEVSKYQQIYFKQIDPKPEKVTTDPDGNYIAHYAIPPKTDLRINLLGKVRVIPYQIVPSDGGKFENLPKDLVKLYTTPKKYWEVNDKSIIELANTLKNHNLTVAQNARLVYEEVIAKLNYDLTSYEETIQRRGAADTIKKQGPLACMEFADTFIAIARAMGIPAREINGYAVSSSDKSNPLSINLISGDLLHAWVEFYDPMLGWVQIDPTWGNTSGLDYFSKLDTNHIVFVRKGISSEQPLPAGSYRFDPTEKQIEIRPSETDTGFFDNKLDLNNIDLNSTFGLNILELIRGKKAFRITNNTGFAIYDINLDLKKLAPFEDATIYLKGDEVIKLKDFSEKEYEYKIR